MFHSDHGHERLFKELPFQRSLTLIGYLAHMKTLFLICPSSTKLYDEGRKIEENCNEIYKHKLQSMISQSWVGTHTQCMDKLAGAYTTYMRKGFRQHELPMCQSMLLNGNSPQQQRMCMVTGPVMDGQHRFSMHATQTARSNEGNPQRPFYRRAYPFKGQKAWVHAILFSCKIQLGKGLVVPVFG